MEQVDIIEISHKHTLRSVAETFIQRVFSDAYGARITYFAETFLAVINSEQQITAVFGYTPAASGALFLEQYLDTPIEDQLSGKTRQLIDRASIVELGNFAAVDPGGARVAIQRWLQHLEANGFSWATLTATQLLRNSLAKMNITTIQLATGDSQRLKSSGDRWGSYFTSNPRVIFGKINSV